MTPAGRPREICIVVETEGTLTGPSRIVSKREERVDMDRFVVAHPLQDRWVTVKGYETTLVQGTEAQSSKGVEDTGGISVYFTVHRRHIRARRNRHARELVRRYMNMILQDRV